MFSNIFSVCLNVMLHYFDQQIETYPKTANLDSVSLILWQLDQDDPI